MWWVMFFENLKSSVLFVWSLRRKSGSSSNHSLLQFRQKSASRYFLRWKSGKILFFDTPSSSIPTIYDFASNYIPMNLIYFAKLIEWRSFLACSLCLIIKLSCRKQRHAKRWQYLQNCDFSKFLKSKLQEYSENSELWPLTGSQIVNTVTRPKTCKYQEFFWRAVQYVR